MSTKLTKEQKEEALKKVAAVLDEAIAEYEMLEKMDLELAEDPTRPFPAAEMNDHDGDDKEEDEKEKDEDEKEKDEDEKEKDEDEKDEDEEEEMSDDAMKSEYAAFTAKMESRGLLSKAEPKAEEVKKSEEAPKADETETLKKSMDDRFDSLSKTIQAIAEKVEKIAASPAPRKGVSGVTPLHKSEDEGVQPLNKAEAVTKLLELKKSGNKKVTSDLIMRIETNRMTDNDFKQIKGILG